MNTPGEHPRGLPRSGLVRSLPALLTVCVALLTLAGALAADRQAQSNARARQANLFADIRAQALDTIDSEVRRTSDLAAGVGADWPAHAAIFAAIARDLAREPGINGVGLLEALPAARRKPFERRHGPIVLATPGGDSHPAPPMARYYVVIASARRKRAPSHIGLDVGGQPTRLATLLAAARTAAPRATPPVRLMSSGVPGTVFYVPIYRPSFPGPSSHAPQTPAQRLAHLLGFASVGYSYELLGPALRRAIPAGTAFSLADGHLPLLAQGTPHHPLRSPIAVAGRSWTLAVGEPAPDLSLPITILLVGALLTLLVATLGVQARRRERYAQALVARRLAEREHAEQALARAEERLRTAFAEAPIGMAVLSPEGRFLQVNRALARITGHSEEQLLALPRAHELTHPEDRRPDERAGAAMRAGEIRVYDVEKRYLHAAGHTVWVAVHTTLIRDPHHQPAYFLSQVEDITDRRRYEAELQHMADHDPLTGLLNRRAYERRLEEHLARGERYGHAGAVLVLDLDDFKQVNDTLGHSAGDQLIVRVASALATRLRESDTLARLGGDEFAILTPTGDRAEAERLANSLLAVVRRERAARGLGGRERPITASIGVAPLEDAHELSAEEALIDADLAMYDAKEAGRDRFETYGGDSRGQARIEARLEWVERIRAALDEDRLVLHAQPVVETATGRTTQHELLVRMVDPHGDLIMPGSFLPIAERFGLVREIDRWVLTRAIRMLGEHRAAGRRPTVEINLSAHSLVDPQLAAHIGRELRAAGVPATQLIFEVTETTAIGNIAAARAFAERLGELGCRFALDDFGAGFGSFYYLKHLPFDYIKIDGEFVRNCTADPTDRLVIRAVVELARGMGKRTIAEFVGDEPTLTTLRELGVDYAQGFHLGPPAPLENWLGLPAQRQP
ncbi:MAG TPA: EAL domain-containing protein [Solirubrobacteraceae bacterium]|jgi:diguanylate cyclase (GGDEF)-like protein/PAS domain S-box-containing protein|nr:EAL domain-containing protein [Solirubrobacteraceae bacterium]